MAKKTLHNSNPAAHGPHDESSESAEVSSTDGGPLAASDAESDAQLEMELEMERESAQQEKFADESVTTSAAGAASGVQEPSIEDELYKEALEDDGGEPKPNSAPGGAPFEEGGASAGHERKKIQIDFPYSNLIRDKVPKVFEVAETVAEEWVNDGTFEKVLEAVPAAHPLTQITVAAGLRKAKDVEKKLEEKGVFAMARMGLEYAKAQLNEKLNKK
jgi:hypothetical protein